MDLTLYGIVFKMRGSLDLLDFVQSDTPVPVDTMRQVMEQMNSVTNEELSFAETLRANWKKGFNEQVPVLMRVAKNGGYDIQCTVPNDLLDTVRTLTGFGNEKIMEEYVADYLKNVCGIDAGIISVGTENQEDAAGMPEAERGFDITDLNALPEEPVFEDAAAFEANEHAQSKEEITETEPLTNVAASEENHPEENSSLEEAYPNEADIPEEAYPAAEDIPEEYLDDEIGQEEAYPDAEDVPEEYLDKEAGQEEEFEAENPEMAAERAMKEALTKIYKELVSNIKEKNLGTRLGLTIQ